jgi:hypothetical protein
MITAYELKKEMSWNTATTHNTHWKVHIFHQSPRLQTKLFFGYLALLQALFYLYLSGVK